MNDKKYHQVLTANRHLVKEVKRLDNLCKKLMAQHSDISCENIRLRASSFVTAVPIEQYERVIKAGDAMAYIMAYENDSEFNGFVDAWNAAKEGKPSV